MNAPYQLLLLRLVTNPDRLNRILGRAGTSKAGRGTGRSTVFAEHSFKVYFVAALIAELD